MNTLARLILNRNVSWAIVVIVTLVGIFGVYHTMRVENDDNLLAFLPQDNPEVKTFYDINTRFGGTDVALVGIESDDPFAPAFLSRLQRLTRELKDTRGLNHVLSLTNVNDFMVDEQNGGIIAAPLVDAIPTSPEAALVLRQKVFSRDHVVGNLVSADGKAVLLYCFLAYGSDPRAMSEKIRTMVTAAFPNNRINWGGNPFISSYVYDTVQKDLKRLSPWAVLVIIFLMFLALRDVVGTFLSLISTCLSIAVTVGLMTFLGVRLNLMLGSMPIVLFAIGCAYSIHILSRYYDWRHKYDNATALLRTMTGIGPMVLAAGTTAAAAILSFVVMDIQPIRTFGLFTAIGILVTMVFALTFVPATIRLFNPRQRGEPGNNVLRRVMVRLAVLCQSRRLPVGAAVVVVGLVCGLLIFRVQTGVDQSSFFRDGSPPDQADKFLREHFGAAEFVQLLVKGDMTDPAVLLEIQSLSDRLEMVPHVSNVQHLGRVVAIINEAMSGEKRIPENAAQVNNLFSFLIGDPSVAQMVTEDRQQALLQIKVDTSKAAELDGVLESIQQLMDGEHLDTFEIADRSGSRAAEVSARKEAELLWHLQRQAKGAGAALPADAAARLHAFLGQDDRAADPKPVAEAVLKFLRSAECAVELPKPAEGQADPAETLAAALAALGQKPEGEVLRAACAKALSLPETDAMVADLSTSLRTPLEEVWTKARVSGRAKHLLAAVGLVNPGAKPDQKQLDDTTMALLDSEQRQALLPAASGDAHLVMQLNGLPVLHRGLARSVKHNQLNSLMVAVFLVILILSIMFRSFKTGLMASLPTLFTLVVIHGAMGLFKINLDVGTSLLGSLILANGIDYAVHLISAWESHNGGGLPWAAACAADRAGPAIWTSASTMFVGFFVLSLGEARVLQNVTGLKAAAMLVGALATFLIVPVLARRRSYPMFMEKCEAIEPSEAVEAVLLESTSEHH